jgi:hypothetical protein
MHLRDEPAEEMGSTPTIVRLMTSGVAADERATSSMDDTMGIAGVGSVAVRGANCSRAV